MRSPKGRTPDIGPVLIQFCRRPRTRPGCCVLPVSTSYPSFPSMVTLWSRAICNPPAKPSSAGRQLQNPSTFQKVPANTAPKQGSQRLVRTACCLEGKLCRGQAQPAACVWMGPRHHRAGAGEDHPETGADGERSSTGAAGAAVTQWPPGVPASWGGRWKLPEDLPLAPPTVRCCSVQRRALAATRWAGVAGREPGAWDAAHSRAESQVPDQCQPGSPLGPKHTAPLPPGHG